MAYSRTDAYNYGKAHWNTACHDGRISIIGAPSVSVEQKRRELGLGSDWSMRFTYPSSGGDEASFVRGAEKKVFQGWDGLGDCAHFISSCLTAGGIKGLVTDYVPYLNGFLRGLSFTKTLASEAPQDRVQRIIDKGLMSVGDIILYVAPTGGELGGGYVHSAMFVSSSTITCHSVARWNDDWTKPHSTGYTFTLIHFAHDDAKNPLLDAQLNGWWKVLWRGENYYYHFANGKVQYQFQKPSSRIPPTAPSQSGYYFYDSVPGDIMISWTKTGSLEELALSSDGNSMSGRWNGSETLTASRVVF